MSDPTRQQLQQAYQLIKTGQREQAGVILIAILKQDRDNADAWWLLANASNEPDKARQALENVLRIRPDDVRARQRLDKLDAPPSEAPSSARFSMPISPAVGPTDADNDPFASFTAPAWADEPSSTDADDLRVVSPFGDLDIDQLDFGNDLPFPDEPPAAPGSVISRPGARTVDTSAAQNDPFGSVSYGGDPFADVRSDSDPFADAGSSVIRPLFGAASTAPRRSGANPVLVIVIIFGVIGAVACIACVALSTQLGQVFEGVVLTVTAMPEFSTLAASQSLPDDLNHRGSLGYGQQAQRTVDTFTDDGWTFSGRSGDRVTIEADAADGDLDPQLTLFDSSGKRVAENDDLSGSNNNARITITLPRTGTYTIVVSAFGSGGSYILRLTRQ